MGDLGGSPWEESCAQHKNYIKCKYKKQVTICTIKELLLLALKNESDIKNTKMYYTAAYQSLDVMAASVFSFFSFLPFVFTW